MTADQDWPQKCISDSTHSSRGSKLCWHFLGGQCIHQLVFAIWASLGPKDIYCICRCWLGAPSEGGVAPITLLGRLPPVWRSQFTWGGAVPTDGIVSLSGPWNSGINSETGGGGGGNQLGYVFGHYRHQLVPASTSCRQADMTASPRCCFEGQAFCPLFQHGIPAWPPISCCYWDKPFWDISFHWCRSEFRGAGNSCPLWCVG